MTNSPSANRQDTYEQLEQKCNGSAAEQSGQRTCAHNPEGIEMDWPPFIAQKRWSILFSNSGVVNKKFSEIFLNRTIFHGGLLKEY